MGSSVACADGVAVVLKNTAVKIKKKVVEAGRILAVELVFNGFHFKLIHVYAPTNQNERTTFFPKLRPVLLGNLPVVMAGDFNCALRDENRSWRRRDRSSWELALVISDHSLTDAGRDLVRATGG